MTPVNLITGFLGTGKTTSIRALLGQAPPDERWAVLVNEMGEVGIDAATLGVPGLVVREVAGGCICCTVSVPFQVAVTQVLADVHPDRLIIEPSGLADPTALIDTLRRPPLRHSVDLRATLTLVHPTRMHDPRIAQHPVFNNQLACADIVVGTFADTSSDADKHRFLGAIGKLDPPKRAVHLVAHGALEPEWLDEPSSPRRWGPAPGPLFQAPQHGHHGQGWVFPPHERFDPRRLEAVLLDLARPGPLLPTGIARLKGIFRVGRSFRRVDATPDSVRWQPVAWRRDSRVQIWVDGSAKPDWAPVVQALRSAIEPSP